MAVEDILRNVPNVRQIKIYPAYSTPKTAETLLSLKFNSTFDYINLDFKPQIDARLYYEFLEKSLEGKAQVCLYRVGDDTEYQNAMK